jgi:hypothetical protein
MAETEGVVIFFWEREWEVVNLAYTVYMILL